jgi:hypothetical protein
MAAVGIGPNVARATGTAEFPTGGWHCIAFSADGAQLRLYVDGQEVAVTDYLADINPPDIPYISIGARLNVPEGGELGPDEMVPNWMLGSLDDVGVWTRALTAEEVSKIYAAGAQGNALTTVVITPPVTEKPEFTSIKRNTDGSITIEWKNGGTLQAATNVAGPWQDVTGAASPYTFTPSAPAMFGRLVK